MWLPCVIPSGARVLLAKLGYMVEWEPECEKKKAIQPSNRPTIKDTLPSAVIPPIFVFFFNNQHFFKSFFFFD